MDRIISYIFETCRKKFVRVVALQKLNNYVDDIFLGRVPRGNNRFKVCRFIYFIDKGSKFYGTFRELKYFPLHKLEPFLETLYETEVST